MRSPNRSTRIGARVLLGLTLIGVQATPAAATDPPDAGQDLVTFEPTEDAPVETAFDEHDQEAIFYANYHGVPIERAVEVSNWMADVAPLLSDLHRLPDVFTHVRIAHGQSTASDLPRGEVRVEVLVTDAQNSDLVAKLDAIEALRAGGRPAEVRVREVPRSLKALQALANAELARWPAGTREAHYDLEDGTVTFSAAEGPAEGFTWTAGRCSELSGGTLDGGRAHINHHPLSGCGFIDRCTTGFPMRFADTYGIATAGHCMDQYAQNASGFVLNPTAADADLYEIWNPGTRYVSANAYWYDAPSGAEAFHHDAGYLRRTSASAAYPGRVWKYSTGEWRHITRYEEFWADEGTTLCVAASAAAEYGPGQFCGIVLDGLTDASGEDTDLAGLNFSEIHFDCTDPDIYPAPIRCGGPGGGSSGGPAYYGGTVYGLVSNANDCGAYCTTQIPT